MNGNTGHHLDLQLRIFLGMLGLFAYPMLGMYKSISASALSRTEQRILLARQVYGSYMARQRGYALLDRGDENADGGSDLVLERFERIKSEYGVMS